MHLISALAAGIRGAENGTAVLRLRGTSSAANYYPDFEATQLLPGGSVTLDSYGSLVAYVAALVDVLVYDSQGVLVREFVAGSEDAAVEVISPSFTGVDYTSGASGTQKPTNLERVLDSWITSAGAPDFKVLVNGVASNLTVLASSIFYNVKSYGAIGNGVADDGTAIAAANTAATAAGGGIVYWPAGTYRVTAPVTLPPNVMWLGSGGLSTKLAIDNVANVGAVLVTAGASGSFSAMQGMWVGEINTNGSTALVSVSGAVDLRATDCVFGNDALTPGICVQAGSGKLSFTRCLFSAPNGFGFCTGTSALTMQSCEIAWTSTTAGTSLSVTDGAIISGNRFSMANATAGTGRFIQVAPTATRPVIVDNSFAGNGVIFPTAIYNSLATPTLDCVEFGNVFGTPTAIVNPRDFASPNYSVFSTLGATGNGSRLTAVEGSAAFVAATYNARPDRYGATSIERTAGAALTVTANTSLGSRMGDRWCLHITNTTGALLTVTLGAGIQSDGVPFTINNGGFGNAEFVFLPQPGGGLGSGLWYQVAPAARI